MNGKTSRESSGGRPEQPLEGWKEIAAHLGRSVRTARRWDQKEGLPVHRQVHDTRTSVYTFPSELDAWRSGREPAASDPTSSRMRWWRPVPALASTVALAVVVLTAGSGPPAGAVAQAADGIVTRQVWAGNDTSTSGAPSPDGQYVSFPDYETGNLAIREVDTGSVRQITTDGSMDSPPMRLAGSSRWSPDGEQLVYGWQGQSPTEELRIIGFDGNEPRTLYRDEKVRWVAPQEWSPDGKQILTSLYFTRDETQLALISVADSTVRILRPLDTRLSNTSFSPDGRYIACDLPHLTTVKKVWASTLRRAGVAHFPIYHLRHTFATRLSAGGVADHFVTQMLRQGDSAVFKRYSQAKLNMMRESLQRLDRSANEHDDVFGTRIAPNVAVLCTAGTTLENAIVYDEYGNVGPNTVWTGSHPTCLPVVGAELGSTNGLAYLGDPALRGSGVWILNGAAGTVGSAALYGISSEITYDTPVPEPGTIGLTALGGELLFLARRRKQQSRPGTP